MPICRQRIYRPKWGCWTLPHRRRQRKELARRGQEKGNVAPKRDHQPAKIVEFPKGSGSPHWTISATGLFEKRRNSRWFRHYYAESGHWSRWSAATRVVTLASVRSIPAYRADPAPGHESRRGWMARTVSTIFPPDPRPASRRASRPALIAASHLIEIDTSAGSSGVSIVIGAGTISATAHPGSRLKAPAC